MSRGDTVLEAKDRVFLIGEARRVRDLVSAVATKAEPVRDVTILGAGASGCGWPWPWSRAASR